MKAFYDCPTQVAFIDPFETEECGERRWLGGIAYEDKIICLECGGVIELDDIEEMVELPWVSLSEECIGDGAEINVYEFENGISDEIDAAEADKESSLPPVEIITMEDGTSIRMYEDNGVN